ncbi:hypothetical protein BCR32DRAFT_266512 [Anaeromyces robustus]|uniref:Dickkopf N-terminal cysteine-rich domain-containing protein n=1 Tax=Anaeromyces robustus TaxID=1754192 RepID=A0A1Y1XFF0_9FUNG|nr:hypothetical protein BCR32DRAFT_266512 [Anaeromyces robustus]|eukprot:ORX84104.1 hypothetical protein BCR32DRAFT_266512 [Anaeromyces robustus]
MNKMYKSISLLFLLLLIDKSISDNNNTIIETTNYTLSYFQNFNSTTSCKTSNDCLPGANCSTGKCNFGTFWCKEDENEKCIMINDKYYNEYNEISKDLNNEPKPFLTTCNIDNIDNGKCKTPKCLENSDCYSNLCYNNNCMADRNVYYCKGNFNQVNCKKQSYMSCNDNSECLSLICTEGICQPQEQKSNMKYLIYIIILLFILCVALFDYFWKVKSKKGKKEKEKEREKEEKMFEEKIIIEGKKEIKRNKEDKDNTKNKEKIEIKNI